MFLVLSGEGPSDIGIQDDKIGPMTKLIDLWIIRRSGYSLIGRRRKPVISLKMREL